MHDQINYKDVLNAKDILGLGERAGLTEIKGAYRTLCKKWHPDGRPKKDSARCHDRMKEINRAYRIILKFVEDYRYSFAKEDVVGSSPEERWKKQFGDDPLWG